MMGHGHVRAILLSAAMGAAACSEAPAGAPAVSDPSDTAADLSGGGGAGDGAGPGAEDGAAAGGAASLRLTEITPAPRADLIELVAVTGGSLDGLRLQELTNSDFSYAFPKGYKVAAGEVIVLHLSGACTDGPSDRASCGGSAPFSMKAWDLSAAGSLTYSGKVLELFAPDGTPMDGVPFVEAHGTEPASFVAAVQRLQRDRVWAATPACVDDPATGLAKDRYCRNISVLWDNLQDDGSNSVQRIGGGAPLAVPGSAAQWSAALPATWGTYR